MIQLTNPLLIANDYTGRMSRSVRLSAKISGSPTQIQDHAFNVNGWALKLPEPFNITYLNDSRGNGLKDIKEPYRESLALTERELSSEVSMGIFNGKCEP